MTARPDIDEGLIQEAIAWHAVLERDDADWDGYLAWLEADPRHRDAFDSIALTARIVDEHKEPLRQLLDTQPAVAAVAKARRWPWMAGGAAVAAVVALAVALPMMRAPEPMATYVSQAGSSRSVTLVNGTSITLSPASRIIVRGKDSGRIELASGEAYFAVRHDPARRLTIEAGPYRITDIGTRFSVNLSGSSFRVAVSEGTISVISDKADGEVRLLAGQQLTSGTNGILSLAKVPAADIGSWREGRLSYTDAPLHLVVADISRYSGQRIIVDPSLENRHFSGTLVIGDGSGLVGDLATVMDLAVRPDDGGGLRLGAVR